MGLQEDMVGPSQSDLECMKILLPGLYAETLSLAQWKVEVFLDGGHLYLHRGWKHFAHALDLQDGFSLVLRYDGKSQINVKVFDLTTCRKQYPHNFEAGGSQLSLPIAEPRSFPVILKKYHLKEKYLNVPVDFEVAHGY
ncbi:B3 domain-containing protein Os03g0212300-like [Miscanthus floridulus]|uniref:B3 domain-containing protein Os03g0212300-like n=1 Tax=Miscanthus floridulus TaxID=154761 RepID=UPI0034584F8B